MSANQNVRVGLVRVDDCQFHPHNVRRDLGDLRTLTDSIRRYGVMQPIVVERRGEKLRIRAGHRRVAAARLAGRTRIPAIVHGEALAEDEWLVHAVQENVMRRDLALEEKVDAIRAMTEQGMTREGIAQAFGVAPTTITAWERKARGESTTVHEDEALVQAENRREQIEQLTRQGKSTSQIADELGVSTRTVVRARRGSRPSQVTRPTLRALAAHLRTQVETGTADVRDVLAALDTFAETLTVPTEDNTHEDVAA